MGDSKGKILVADDDPKLLREVEVYLGKQGFGVSIAKDGYSALALVESTAPDLVVLDIAFQTVKGAKGQPLDGIEILRRLRDSSKVPVLMLSSTNAASVKVMALTIGADDYLDKPFDLPELDARIDSILRRLKGRDARNEILTFRRLKLDPGERRAWKDGVAVALTSVEFDMLYTLARRPNYVFTRDKLLELAWKDPSHSVPKVVDVHIGHIRKKVEDNPSKPTHIVTVHGTGYRFEEEPA